MNKPAKIQIDFDLFLAMKEYIETHPDRYDPDYEFITKGIQEKFDAMYRRTMYKLYKTSDSKEIRSYARREYLDLAGIDQSFRWTDEQDVNVIRHNPDDPSR